MRRDPEAKRYVMAAEPADGQLDAGAIMAAIWRRRYWIAIPAILAAFASAAFVLAVAPRFKSEARVLIENRETVYSRPEAERAGNPDRPLLDQEAVQSQVQLMLSRDLARRIVRDLKLADRPEFNPDARGATSGWFDRFASGRRPDANSIEENVLARFYDRLNVFQVERSRVVAVDFWSHNPDLAAEIANALAEGYLSVQRAAKYDSMRQASQWLSGEIEQMRARVADSEAKVEEFRSKANLYVGSNNNPLSAQQLGELNSQLVLARTQMAEAESKVRLIREMLRSGQQIEASDIVNSELIRRLNEQRVTFLAQLAEQSATLLPQHPRIKELRAQIADLEAQTRREAEKLVRTLEGDARIAGARVETLAGNLEQVKRQASALGEQDVQLRALEREAKAQRDLLEAYLSRYRDASSRDTPEAVLPDARIVSRAVASPAPYFPRKLPIILVVTFATLIGMGTIVAAGALLRGGESHRAEFVAVEPAFPAMPTALPPQPVSWIGTPNAGHGTRSDAPARAKGRKLALVAEQVRGFGRGIVTVAGTSGEELAARVAIELGRLLAENGARVLYLDLDVKAGSASTLVMDPRAPGFGDLLFGVASFSQVIQRHPASRMHVIPVGRGVGDTDSLLGAEKLGIAFGALSQTYDHIVVAAPAIGSMKGAERLARFSRSALIVAAEGGEGAGAAASDAAAAKGFTNVVVVTLSQDAGQPESPGGRAAA